MSKIKLTLGQQQRLNDLTVPALVAAFLASPFYFCLFAAGYTYIKHTHRTLTAKIPTYLGGAACAFFFIFIERFIRDPLSLCFPPTILNWLFVPKSLVVGLDCACTPLPGLSHQIKCCWSDPNRSDRRGKSILTIFPLSTARTLPCWVPPDPEKPRL